MTETPDTPEAEPEVEGAVCATCNEPLPLDGICENENCVDSPFYEEDDDNEDEDEDE